MEGLGLGTLEFAVAHDGAIATVHKPIGVLGIPFLYENHEHAWRVYDSAWLKEFSDDMVKKAASACSTRRQRRAPFHQQRAADPRAVGHEGPQDPHPAEPGVQDPRRVAGASASAIPWPSCRPRFSRSRRRTGERRHQHPLPRASTSIRSMTLDGHVWSIHAYMVNERFYQGLNAAQKKAAEEATKKAIDIHRRMTADQDKQAKQILSKVGMEAPGAFGRAGRRIPQARAATGERAGREESASPTSTASSARLRRRRSNAGFCMTWINVTPFVAVALLGLAIWSVKAQGPAPCSNRASRSRTWWRRSPGCRSAWRSAATPLRSTRTARSTRRARRHRGRQAQRAFRNVPVEGRKARPAHGGSVLCQGSRGTARALRARCRRLQEDRRGAGKWERAARSRSTTRGR